MAANSSEDTIMVDDDSMSESSSLTSFGARTGMYAVPHVVIVWYPGSTLYQRSK